MARGISIRDVSNKIKNISDKDVLPISTGDNQPPETEAISNTEIDRIFNKLNN